MTAVVKCYYFLPKAAW